MKADITLRPVSFKSLDYKKVSSLYLKSFPKNERLPLWLLSLRSRLGGIDFLAIYHGDTFVGFSYIFTDDDISFIMYLAIDGDLRGKGYGSKTLSAIKDFKEGNKLILNIESLIESSENYEQRLKRKNFYMKNGFTSTGIISVENNVTFETLAQGDITLDIDAYMTILKKIATPIFSPLVKYTVKFK